MNHKAMSRRACLASGVTLLSGPTTAVSAIPSVRLGILQFGTVQWVADVIRGHALDSRNGVTLETSTLANADAGRVALMANAIDIVTSDWLFVATQRSAGTKLCFAPFSSSLGGIMVRPDSPIRSLSDLAHRRLGVAGGPVDKSWLIVRAATKAAAGFDPADVADVVYGAPPLLNAKLMQQELDAVLTYWNFAARLETEQCRQVVAVSDCARDLGMPSPPCLLGFVFREAWGRQNPNAINGFLRAAASAEDLMDESDGVWREIRPVMNAPEDALFDTFRQRFLAGVAHPSADAQQHAAQQLLDVLLQTGGTRGTDGIEQLPSGIFWPAPRG
jgi:NitT/TauT family transport system substrate-binding protein